MEAYTYDEVYDRIVVPNSSCPHMRPCILKGLAAELPPLYFWPSMPTRSRRSTRTHPTSTRPRARLLIGLTSTDLPSDQSSVFLLQKGVMMTNKPPKGLRAPPQLPRLHRIHSDPIKDMFADFLATRLCVGRQRGLLEPDKIAMASRLYRLPEQVCKSSARSWMDVYDHATLRHTSSPRPSSHPE